MFTELYWSEHGTKKMNTSKLSRSYDGPTTIVWFLHLMGWGWWCVLDMVAAVLQHRCH